MLTKCGPSRPDIQLSKNAVQQELTAIIEVYFEQDTICSEMEHALDTAKNDTFSMSSEHFFEAVCGFFPVAWGTGIDYDYKKHSHPDACCCPCDSTQPLAEDDMLEIFNRFLFKKDLPCDWVTVNELETPAEYCDYWDEGFPRVILTDWTGKGADDSLSDLLHKIDSIIVDTYNGVSFDRCDGRQITDSEIAQVRKRSKKSGKHDRLLVESSLGYVTEYPQSVCKQSCTESFVKGRGLCRNEDQGCPDYMPLLSEDVSLMRRLSGQEDDFKTTMMFMNRELYNEYPDYSLPYVIDVIWDHCLCRKHFDQPNTLPEKPKLIETINKEFMGHRDWLEPQVGAIYDMHEYVPFKAGGHPYDITYPKVLVYVEEGLCKAVKDKHGDTYYEVDEAKVHDLLEVIRRSFNDMTIEECDKPLFRQLLYVALINFFHGEFDCNRDDFVLDLTIDLRCYGHCSGPFDDYSSRNRGLNRERSTAHATRNMVVEKEEHGASSTIMMDDKSSGVKRELNYGDYHPPEGLCALESASAPKSPTFEGWQDRVNANKPSGHGDVYILWDYHGKLCRCETDEESHYYGFHDWYIVNGIYVAPKFKCPSEASVEYYMYDIYYC